MMFEDIDELVRAWLETQLAAADLPPRLVIRDLDLPGNLLNALPLIQVVGAVGSAEVAATIDAPVLDVDTYAATVATAKTVAEQVRWQMRYVLPGRILGNTHVRAVTTFSGPAPVPFEASNVFHVAASYQLVVRPSL